MCICVYMCVIYKCVILRHLMAHLITVFVYMYKTYNCQYFPYMCVIYNNIV